MLLLGELYDRASLGFPPDQLHRDLADYLGCHQDVHRAAWDLWRTELELSGQDPNPVGAWLDFDFYGAVPVE